jgi:hypothetical protein
MAAVDRAAARLGIGPPGRERLGRLVSSFADSVVLAVEARGAVDRLWVRSDHVVTPAGPLATRHDRLRALLGLPPYRYRIPVEWAFAAQRYHLRVTGAPGQFVYRHGLAVDGGPPMPAGEARAWAQARPPARVEVHGDVGLPYAELTVTGARQVAGRAECVVEFEEVPPGALGRTLLISAVGSVLVVAFALLLPHLESDDGSADPAILLAATAFVATWLGQSAERVRRSSVTTVIGLAATGAISLTGSLLYLIRSVAGGSWTQAHLPGVAVLPLPPVDLPWLVLSVLSLSVTGVLFCRWRHGCAGTSRRFAGATRRPRARRLWPLPGRRPRPLPARRPPPLPDRRPSPVRDRRASPRATGSGCAG